MRVLRLALLVTATCLVVPTSAWSGGKEPGKEPSAPAPSARVGIFYYPWFGPAEGRWLRALAAGRAHPPADVASSFYPARGPYSSADALVVGAQMREIAAAGVGR